MSMLVPRLYRSLLRLARRVDKNVLYKAFIPSIRALYYDREQSIWIPIDKTIKSKPDDATLGAFRELTRGYTGQGMFYHPLSSSITLLTMIRSQFRSSGSDEVAMLDTNQRIDLAFVALRYLSRCLNVASKLEAKSDDTIDGSSDSSSSCSRSSYSSINTSSSSSSSSSSRSSSSSSSSSDNVKRLDATTELGVGRLLISHPLLYERDSTLTQSCVLIVSHSDALGSLGIVVNSPLHCTLGDKLSQKWQKSYPHLKHFIDCELYAGGDVIADHPVSLLHTRPLSPAGQQTGRYRNTTPQGSPDGISSSSAGNSYSPRRTSSTRSRGGGDGSDSESGSGHALGQSIEIALPTQHGIAPESLYFTSDLKWAAREVEAGRVRPDEFKVIVGYAGWGTDQLRGECDMHSWFMCEGQGIADVAMARFPLDKSYSSSGSSWSSCSSSSIDDSSDSSSSDMSSSGNVTVGDGNMSSSAGSGAPKDSLDMSTTATATVTVSATATTTPATGHSSWSHVLRGMGGEFAAFARTIDYNRPKVGDAEMTEEANVAVEKVFEELHDLSLYGVDCVI